MIVTFPVLIRIGAIAALVGGTLRFGSSFIPWVEGSVSLETLYFVTDVALLFGLFAIYLARAVRLGLLGLVGFAIAAVGQAANTFLSSLNFSCEPSHPLLHNASLG